MDSIIRKFLSDQCCTPTDSRRGADWSICRLYYQYHPPSTCIGYRSTGTGKKIFIFTEKSI